MNCSSHPAVAAIANCATCQTPLCGECAMASGEDSYLCTRCVALSAVNDFNQESEQKDKKAEQKVVDGELQQKRGVKTQIVIIAVCMLIMTVQFFRIFSDDIFMTKFEEPITPTEHSNRCMAFIYAVTSTIESDNSLDKNKLANYCPEPPFVISQTYSEITVESPDAQSYGFSELRIDRESLFLEVIE
ncbi:MAG: hypothetical protein HN764_09905 [Gammaproteobacteria bacterium]|nr:hypothetical protein [Gammaproteobacteria bacterium]